MTTESDGDEHPKNTYTIGNVGSGARVAQGSNIVWTEAGTHASPQLMLAFKELLEQISQAQQLDEVEREIAYDKIQTVSQALALTAQSPARLRSALTDAHAFLSTKANWAWHRLVDILRSDAARGIVAGIAEASTRAAIETLIKSGQ